jgi:hypothetical protein
MRAAVGGPRRAVQQGAEAPNAKVVPVMKIVVYKSPRLLKGFLRTLFGIRRAKF